MIKARRQFNSHTRGKAEHTAKPSYNLHGHVAPVSALTAVTLFANDKSTVVVSVILAVCIKMEHVVGANRINYCRTET